MAGTRYYKKWRKGMRKSKNGMYYYPKKNTQNTKKYSGRENFALKRQPIVETKKNTEALVSERLQEGSYAHFVPISSFIRMNQGTETDQFLGDSIFSKYISCKLNFKFPQGANCITQPYRIQIIHGWVTAPFSLDSSGVTSYVRSNVSRSELDTIVVNRVGPAFNQSVDRMNFRDKEKKIYKIEGKKWVRLNRNGMISQSVLSLGITGHGGPPDSFHQLHWKPMRKVNLTYSDDSNSTLPPSPFHYPNEAWIPFVCIYTPDKDNLTNPDPTKPLPDESRVLLESMNCHWYTDS